MTLNSNLKKYYTRIPSDKGAIMEKPTSLRICGIKAECLNHLCQDDLFTHQFIDNNGDTVWVGAISDGCSGSFGAEHGSAFLVRTFAEEAERLGKKGNRDSDFLHNVILALAERMESYKPRDQRSEIVSYNEIEISGELAATLYGFVVDEEKIQLVMAGDGFLAINGHDGTINQTSGDLYPSYLLRFPKKTWEERLTDIFFFAEFQTDRVNDLVLATDGFGHPAPRQYPGLTRNPAMFILQAKHHATTSGSNKCPGAHSSRGGDDATALAFAKIGMLSDNPVCADEIKQLCQEVANHGSKNFQDALSKACGSIILPCAFSGDVTSGSIFKREINISEGVHLYGITDKDIAEYARRGNQIVESRISYSDDSNPLSFLSGNKKNLPTTAVVQPTNKKGGLTPRPTPIMKHKKVELIPLPQQHEQKYSRKLIPFLDICSPNHHVRRGIGFRHFGRVMYDLWHFIQNCHDQGLRFGSLRPCDLALEIINDTKPPTYHFSLVNPDSVAKVDKQGELLKKYSGLDINFIHPEYLGSLSFDDKARLDQDWYAYSVLCCWLVTKFDPFGAGTVINKPETDRIYRMKHNMRNQSSKVDTVNEQEKLFIKRALGRLSPDVEEFVRAFVERDNLHQDPDFLLDEFRPENILTCEEKTTKHGRNVRCGFKQLPGFNVCEYCKQPHVKMLALF